MWNNSYPLLSENIDFLWKKSEVRRKGKGREEREGKGRKGRKRGRNREEKGERIIQMYPLLMNFIV